MRVMVIVKASKDSEAGLLPPREMIEKMGKFNQELMQAGVFLGADGLKASSSGKRIKFSGQQRTITDGPFTETKELIAGYWLWQVKTLEEAVEWLKRAPFDGGTEVELRPVFEMADFAQNYSGVSSTEARGTAK
jgi:hypothetical protein